jgi:hypothetical protein
MLGVVSRELKIYVLIVVFVNHSIASLRLVPLGKMESFR